VEEHHPERTRTDNRAEESRETGQTITIRMWLEINKQEPLECVYMKGGEGR
jgi:hypothetical protein